ALPVPVAVVSAEQTITIANDAFLRTLNLGPQQIRGLTWERASALAREKGKLTSAPLSFSGETLLVIEKPTPQAAEVEREGSFADRADAMAHLAGRVAHEINNPLAVIAMSAEMGETEQILEATTRISIITRQLVEIARNHARPAGSANLT